jgi:hypothetical protein
MSIILTIRIAHLRNEAHYQFLLLLKKRFETYPNVASIVSTLLQQFYPLLTLEGTLVDAIRGSEYTKQLAETDHRLDRAIVGLVMAVNTALHHPDPNCVKAAEQLKFVLKAFRGEIENRSYEEESAAVKILVVDLQGKYAQAVNTLGLSVWVSEISVAQAAFEQFFLLRDDERAVKPQERLKDLRKQLDSLYRQIRQRIEAYTVMNGEGTTGAFISRLNEEITYFNEHIRHRVPKDINLATVSSIPDTVWEGKAVTPLPTATYEGHELIFAFDYDVSYRNNTVPRQRLRHPSRQGRLERQKDGRLQHRCIK